MEKNMEDEMETGVYRDIGHISVPLRVFGRGGAPYKENYRILGSKCGPRCLGKLP